MVYRRRAGEAEILLVHPGGPYWRGKDEGAWSIPKGEIEVGEDASRAAAREFQEEVGLSLCSHPVALTPRAQKGGKLILPWMIEADLDVSGAKSGVFEMQWPPGSGATRWFPEVDRVA